MRYKQVSIIIEGKPNQLYTQGMHHLSNMTKSANISLKGSRGTMMPMRCKSTCNCIIWAFALGLGPTQKRVPQLFQVCYHPLSYPKTQEMYCWQKWFWTNPYIIWIEPSDTPGNRLYSWIKKLSALLNGCKTLFLIDNREFKIPQWEWQCQLQNLFLCFPAEKLSAKSYHKCLIR